MTFDDWEFNQIIQGLKLRLAEAAKNNVETSTLESILDLIKKIEFRK